MNEDTKTTLPQTSLPDLKQFAPAKHVSQKRKQSSNWQTKSSPFRGPSSFKAFNLPVYELIPKWILNQWYCLLQPEIRDQLTS